MLHRSAIGFAALAALLMTTAGALAFDDAKYPDLKGQWLRARVPGAVGQPPWDPTKPPGRGQQAPLTSEYQAIFEANVVEQAAGGFGWTFGWRCRTSGMPLMMNLFEPAEIVVLPDTTYILISQHNTHRRIFTDGRDWPAEIEPSFIGYSIGKWIDTDGDGKYDTLEVETRGFKGPRSYDASGLPLHIDNQSVVKERIFLNKTDPNLLHDEITVIDNALTRPWTVMKNYRRNPNRQPVWNEYVCAEGNAFIAIGKDGYFTSADGYLMPARKDQPPPDLRYFPQAQR
jgi:hypothetical protein